MQYSPGDLVEVTKERSEKYTGIILSGTPTSLYVEARPYKIIDEVVYKIISGGKDMFAYGYQIRKLND
jgi:phospholipid N-methyltransferase